MKIIVPAALLAAFCCLFSCSNQDKSEASVFFLKGNIQFKEKQFAEAVRLYDEAIRKYPSLTDAYLNKGLALVELEKPELAYDVFTAALTTEDGFHEARLARAEAALRLGRLNQAEDDLALLASVYRDSTRFYLIRGNLMVDRNQKEAAYADFDKAVVLNGNNVEALVNRGTLLFEDGKIKEAKEDFYKALSINPVKKEALNNMGMVVMREGNPGKALEYFDKVLIRIPNEAFTLNNKGEALLKSGRPEEALKALNRSLEIRPDNGHTLKNLGLYYLEQKDYAKASEFLDRAVTLEQHVPGLHGLAGKAHWHLNDLAGACKIWAVGKILKDSLAIAESGQYCK